MPPASISACSTKRATPNSAAADAARRRFHSIELPDIAAGTRYGLRADGVYSPDHGLWFDPSKLLVDPYAAQLDRPFRHDQRLTVFGEETADLVPKAIVTEVKPLEPRPPLFQAGGLIYEIAVKPFTILHPGVPERKRGTVAALAEPVIIDHLTSLGVSAVELMPVVAWIDERHLPPLGLHNGWGYNPIAPMALDPRLVPGGIEELRRTVEVLHQAGTASSSISFSTTPGRAIASVQRFRCAGSTT